MLVCCFLLALNFLPYFYCIFFVFFYNLSCGTALFILIFLPNNSVLFNLLIASFIYYLVEKCIYPIPIPLLVCRLFITLTDIILPIAAKWSLSCCYWISCDKLPANTVVSVSVSFYLHGVTLNVSYLNNSPFSLHAY